MAQRLPVGGLIQPAPAIKPPTQGVKPNNFDFLMFVFACTVALVHLHTLSGLAAFEFLPALLSSALAVKAFFVVSGFLIVMSCERSSSLGRYASKRFKRIYPAYALVIVLSALALSAVSTQSAGAYFSGALRYVAANLVFANFLQPTLPGVFDGNPLQAVNGALWTLKIEVMFYASVPLLVLLIRRFSAFSVLLAVYVLSSAYLAVTAHLASTGSQLWLELNRQLPGQLVYFVSGALFYYHPQLLQTPKSRWLAAALAVAVLAGRQQAVVALREPLAVATLVMCAAWAAPQGGLIRLDRFGLYGDFSYGIYIVHFPIIQLLTGSSLRSSPAYFAATAIVLIGLAAAASWFGVERRFLVRSRSSADKTPVGVADRQNL